MTSIESSMKSRVILDTNVYLSAIIYGGNPRECLEMGRAGKISLFTSKAILLEIATKLKSKFFWSEDDIKEVLIGTNKFTTLIDPTKKLSVIKADPPDNRILEVALEAKADFIISGDKKHLLSLKEFQRIEIISAADFFKRFGF